LVKLPLNKSCVRIGKDYELTLTHFNFVWIVVGGWKDLGHVRGTRDVLIVTNDVHGVLAFHCWPVGHVGGAIAVVGAVNLGLNENRDIRIYR